jgi:hypothetical protein
VDAAVATTTLAERSAARPATATLPKCPVAPLVVAAAVHAMVVKEQAVEAAAAAQ